MKPLVVLPLMLLAFTTPSHGRDRPAGAAVDRFVLTKIRLLPKPGAGGLLAGARITGSNEGPTTAFVALARIDRAPAGDDWFEVTVPPGEVYRFLKIESAKGVGLALAEIEFYSPSSRLRGNGFGTSVGDKKSTTFDKALDGDPNTFFESPAENSYVGIDLGGQAQAPVPRFNPAGGAFAAAQKVEIGTWPPGATIYCTTDGSVPTASNGRPYRGPIQVSRTTSFAAIASQAGLADSDVVIATYRIGAAAAAQQQVKSYHLGNSLTDTISGFLEPIADNEQGQNAP